MGIVHGSVSSWTAEAVFITLCNGLQYLSKYNGITLTSEKERVLETYS